jgi:hypothetical protein
MGDRVEPLVDGAMQFGLPAGQHVAHLAQAGRGLDLQPRQLFDPLFGGFGVAATHGAHRGNDNRAQGCQSGQGGHSRASDDERIVGHANPLYSDSHHKNKK